MKAKMNEPTMFYQYGNEEKEFVFCVKGRPFPCLVSPYLPTTKLDPAQLIAALGPSSYSYDLH